MTNYKISDKLYYTLDRDNVDVVFNSVELNDGSNCCLAKIHLNKYYLNYTFEVDCGKPNSVKELEDNLAKAVEGFIGGDDSLISYKLADEYFRKHLEKISIRDAIDYGEVIGDALICLRDVLKTYQGSV